jgi:uncharacterized protein YjiS (DUF1127 family)
MTMMNTTSTPGLRWRRKIALWRARAAERDALASMSERELRDIGVTPAQAYAEASKPFWSA